MDDTENLRILRDMAMGRGVSAGDRVMAANWAVREIVAEAAIAADRAARAEPIGEIVDAPSLGITAVSIPVMPPVGTKLYTRPQPVAVPEGMVLVPETDPRYLHLLDLLGAKDHEDAARIIAGHHARELLHHQLDVRSPVVREFMDAMRDQRESDEKNFHGYSLTRQVCAGLMAIGGFVPTPDGDGGKDVDHSIQHAPQCSSLTVMLTCNPPRPAPCDCGAAAHNPETTT